MSTDPTETPSTPADPAPATPPPSDPAPATPSFLDGFTDPDMRTFVEGKKWQDANAVVESYRNLEKIARGADPERVIEIPADPADMGAVWDRLGRPEAAENYTATLPDDMQDGVYSAMAATAHEAGLTDAQWGVMQTKFAETVEAVRTEQSDAFDKAFETWRQSNPVDHQNVVALNQAVGTSPEEMTAAMNGDQAAFYGILSRIASRMGEQPPVPSDPSNPSPTTGFQMTPTEARAKVEQMNADPAFQDRLYHSDPKVREAAAAERREFMIIANNDTDTANSEIDRLRRENAALKNASRKALDK